MTLYSTPGAFSSGERIWSYEMVVDNLDRITISCKAVRKIVLSKRKKLLPKINNMACILIRDNIILKVEFNLVKVVT